MLPYIDNAVNEGLADYFAAAIAKNPQLAKKIKTFSTATGKSGKKRKAFEYYYENKPNGDFVLSLLWGIRPLMGENKTDQLVLESRKYMQIEKATIQESLIDAIVKSCKSICENPLQDTLKLQHYFHEQAL